MWMCSNHICFHYPSFFLLSASPTIPKGKEFKLIDGVFNYRLQKKIKDIRKCKCGNSSDFVIFKYRVKGIKWVFWFDFYCADCYVKLENEK